MDTLNYRIPDAESALSDAESALELEKMNYPNFVIYIILYNLN